MAKQLIAYLKERFENGDIPDEQDFWDVLDSYLHLDNVATVTAATNHAATLKSAIIDADEVTGLNSASSFSLIRTTWASIKAFLKTYFDTLYGGLSMAANSIKGNATAATANSTDIALSTNQVLGRLSANIVPIDITNILSSKGTLISGNHTVIDANITVNSWAIAFPSTGGTFAGTLKFTASAGSMLFTTSEATSTYSFGYIIFL